MNSCKLQVFVVEDHHDVLPYIYRQIGAKRLPIDGIVLVHFDSHPDLLIPSQLLATDIYNKDKVLDSTSIENWIVPLLFAGHVNNIMWVKPPWSTQIPDQQSYFSVGEQISSGHIKVSCAEPYFLSELLYENPDDMRNCKSVTLNVCTIDLGNTNLESTFSTEHTDVIVDNLLECNTRKAVTVGSKRKHTAESTSDSTLGADHNAKHPKNEAIKCDVLGNCSKENLILDIDLDFFSVCNPFKQMFNEKQYSLLKELYQCSLPDLSNKKSMAAFTKIRSEQLSCLCNIFLQLSSGVACECLHGLENGMMVKVTQLVDELKKDCPKELLLENDNDTKSVDNTCESFQENQHVAIDYEWLHEIGCTFDHCELPHHRSNERQIDILLQKFRVFLINLKKTPTIVTIARSSNDDYCPKDQVNSIQEKVIQILEDVYGDIVVNKEYTAL